MASLPECFSTSVITSKVFASSLWNKSLKIVVALLQTFPFLKTAMADIPDAYEITYNHPNAVENGIGPGKVGVFGLEAAHETIERLKAGGHEVIEVKTPD